MIITWHREGCFRLQNGDVSVVIDPPHETTGVSAPRFRPNLLIKTLTAWPLTVEASQEGADMVVNGAGEYDMHGIMIRGFQLPDESAATFLKTVYTLTWDSVTVGLLGHCSGVIPPNVLEHFEDLDVLIAPAGGEPFADTESMVKLVKQLNPKVFIPSFIYSSGIKRKAIKAQECAQRFNGGTLDEMEKFVFKKKDLADIKKTRVICLKA